MGIMSVERGRRPRERERTSEASERASFRGVGCCDHWSPGEGERSEPDANERAKRVSEPETFRVGERSEPHTGERAERVSESTRLG